MKNFTFQAKTKGTITGYVFADNATQAMELIQQQQWFDLIEEETTSYFNFEIIDEEESED